MKKFNLTKSFYFIRHAQTDANKNEIMCGGDSDIPINSEGEEQANKARNKFKKIEKQIKQVYRSPMKRVQMTLDLILDGSVPSIEVVEGLREWCVGEWENRPWNEVPNPYTTNENPPGGEALLEFKERVLSCVEIILSKHENGEALVVAHGGVGHIIFRELGIDLENVENAVIYYVHQEGSSWNVEKV